MNILVACEESQRVCMAFRRKGHRAFSCDIIECSGEHPEWHIKDDVLNVINGDVEFETQDGNRHRQRREWELPKYDQVIQPYEFGHPYSKRTCLWLKNLPKLKPTEIIAEHEPYVNGGCKDRNGNYRKAQGRKERDQRMRSKTFWGIANAMAEQWG